MLSHRRRLAATVVIANLAVIGGHNLALAGSPASMPPDGEPLTVAEVTAAAEASADAAQRFEMYFDFEGMPMFQSDSPLATGESSGEIAHVHMDFGAILRPMLDDPSAPAELRDADLTMEMITRETELYLRAPFFAVIAEQAGPQAGPFAVFAELGDGWGYVDLTQLPGVDPADITGSLGGVGAGDPTAFYALLFEASKPQQIGSEEIHGVESTGVSVEVSLGAVLEAQGTELDGVPAAELEQLDDVTIPIEVWIGDGFVRRIVFSMTGESLAGAVDDPIDDALFESIGLTMTLEMFDYNDPSIQVEVPADYTDVTAEFAELMEMAGMD